MFLRPPPLKPSLSGTSTEKKNQEPHKLSDSRSLMPTASAAGYCTACGLNLATHVPTIKQEAISDAVPCPICPGGYMRLPIVDAHSLVGGSGETPYSQHQHALAPSGRGVEFLFSVGDVCSAVDPSVITAVNGWTGTLGLASFGNRVGHSLEHMDGPSLAGAAVGVLGLALRAFVRRVVAGGVAVLREDVGRRGALGRGGGGGGRGAREGGSRNGAVLSPSHLARGVGSSSEGHAEPAGLALATLGLLSHVVHTKNVTMATRAGAASGPPGGALVKEEAGE